LLPLLLPKLLSKTLEKFGRADLDAAEKAFFAASGAG
jgi:hypothetical protein